MRGSTSRRASRRGQARKADAAHGSVSGSDQGHNRLNAGDLDIAAAAAGVAKIMARNADHADRRVAMATTLSEALPLIGRAYALALGPDGRIAATATAADDAPRAQDFVAARSIAAAALHGAKLFEAETSALPLRARDRIVGALVVSGGTAPEGPGYVQALDLLADCLGALAVRPDAAPGAKPAPRGAAVTERLIEALAGHPDGVALFGPDGGLIAANPAFAAAYDAKVGDLRGLTMDEILQFNHDGVAPVLVGRDLRGERDERGGAELALAADGRWLRLSRQRTAAGDEMVLQSPADDVVSGAMTARRSRVAGESDIREKSAYWAGAGVGMAILNRAGRVVDANPEAERLLKSSRRALLGRKLGRLRGEADDMWIPVGGARGAKGRLAAKARPLQGGRTLLALIELPESGAPAAPEASATSADQTMEPIAEPIADENTIRRALAAAQALGELGHEMRTPLNAVIGFADIMLARSFGPVNDRQAQYLTDIGQAGRHMLEMVDHMLDHAQLASGRYPYVPEWVDLTELANETARLLEPAAADGAVEVSVDAPDDLEAYIDRRGVMQALINLMTNAVKFTPAEGTVELAVELDDDGLYLTVSDTGEGIPDEDLERVMEPFTQARRLGGRPLKGAGLGLSIVQALAELHDGSVAIASKLGQGTEVTLQLPASRARRAARDVEEDAEEAEA